VTVQAGVTGAALAAALASRRQTLPLDPPGWRARTLGGMTATGASGPLRLRYGTMRDLLLGVRFVQADGVSTWGGARVVKSVTGYDIPKLLVGSLGTLGILGELTLRLHPQPEAEAVCLLPLRGPEAAEEVVARLVDSTLQLHRLELLDGGALAACGLPAAPLALVVAMASVEPAVRAQQARVAAEATRAGARVETMGPGFWRTYAGIAAASGPTVLRVSTLATRLAPTLAEVQAALGSTGLVVTGCPPLGLFRVAVAHDDAPRLAKAVERLRAFVAGDDGSVVIERGSSALRASIDPWGPVAPGPLALIRGLKQTFDPRGTLNPGRFVDGL
jgi:glycolate oxidase FAD binding subunit